MLKKWSDPSLRRSGLRTGVVVTVGVWLLVQVVGGAVLGTACGTTLSRS